MSELADAVADFLAYPVGDPARLYRRMREEAPLFRTAQGVWILTRYADVDAVARELDVRFSRDSGGRHVGYDASSQFRPAQLLLGRTMAFRDPPDHARLRSLVNKAFTPTAVASMQDSIETRVRALARSIARRGEVDLLADFAGPLPIGVIADMFGMGSEHHAQLESIGHAVVRFLDMTATEDDRAHADAETVRFTQLISELAALRREEPGDDLLTALVMAEDSGDRLTQDELVSACFIITAAGHETTTNLIGNLVQTLLSDRARWQELCDDPSLVPAAVEEGLRYEPPLRSLMPQWPIGDTQIGGVTIKEGERLALWIGAANRDPAVFDHPDEFDMHRPDNRHLAFSAGRHFCLGAALARLEARVAVTELALQFPKLELLDAQPTWRPIVNNRALETLPVRCS